MYYFLNKKGKLKKVSHFWLYIGSRDESDSVNKYSIFLKKVNFRLL